MIKKYCGRVGFEPLMRNQLRGVSASWCFVIYNEVKGRFGRIINCEISTLYSREVDMFELLFQTFMTDIKFEMLSRTK